MLRPRSRAIGKPSASKTREAESGCSTPPLAEGGDKQGSTVLLCRVTNQTIVCSRTDHGRGRERRSHIDPREHQQLITQIYVPIVHCLTGAATRRDPGADHSMEAVPAGRSGRDQSQDGRCTERRERRRGRRREEIKGGPSRIARIRARIEEGNAKSRETERADHRRAAPPATNAARSFALSVLVPCRQLPARVY